MILVIPRLLDGWLYLTFPFALAPHTLVVGSVWLFPGCCYYTHDTATRRLPVTRLLRYLHLVLPRCPFTRAGYGFAVTHHAFSAFVGWLYCPLPIPHFGTFDCPRLRPTPPSPYVVVPHTPHLRLHHTRFVLPFVTLRLRLRAAHTHTPHTVWFAMPVTLHAHTTHISRGYVPLPQTRFPLRLFCGCLHILLHTRCRFVTCRLLPPRLPGFVAYVTLHVTPVVTAGYVVGLTLPTRSPVPTLVVTYT